MRKRSSFGRAAEGFIYLREEAREAARRREPEGERAQARRASSLFPI